MKSLRFHEAAKREADLATIWLNERSKSSALKFTEELLSAFAQVSRLPQRYPSFLHGTRRILLRKFPYLIVYLDWQDEVFIVAVAHSKRRPGYWKRRI